jgi:hypothetical protein
LFEGEPVATEMVDKQARSLVRLLWDLRALQERLLEVVEARIDAMKRADLGAMRELGEREEALTRKIYERDGLRRQLADTIGEALGAPARSGRSLTVRQLAARVGDAVRPELLDAAAGLRDAVLRVVRANRIAGIIACELVQHLRWVFASVRPAAHPVGYSGAGAVVGPAGTRLFEAVG